MKRKYNFLLTLLLLALLLCGCNAKGDSEDFTQRELPTPDRMEVLTGSAVVTYEPESEEYAKIWDALRPNWWKTAADTPDTAPDDALFLTESPDQLKTTTDRTTRDNCDSFVCFYYDEAPLKWVEANGKTTNIQLVAFLLPDAAETTENVKGCFLISKTGQIGNNEGLFTYYYPPEIAAGFWDFLLH